MSAKRAPGVAEVEALDKAYERALEGFATLPADLFGAEKARTATKEAPAGDDASSGEPALGQFTCLSKILGLGEPGTWTARLRRWVVLYKRKTWKRWRIDESCGAHVAKRQRSLSRFFDYPTRKMARAVAEAYRKRGYSARVRKAFIEIPLEP